MQFVLPAVLFGIALRLKSHVAPFALCWVSENIPDVSLHVSAGSFRSSPATHFSTINFILFCCTPPPVTIHF